ncbi:MAG: hypothetical protein AB1757_16715 [Acidobacteriota bacterium]
MAIALTFEVVRLYNSGEVGITVPVSLQLGSHIAEVDAKLDTGSTYCIFQRYHGEALNLDIESGYQQQIYTVNSSFAVYGHYLTLSVFGFDFDGMIYFAKDDDFKRDVLGRHGFLDRVQIGVRDYQGELYLSRNDS